MHITIERLAAMLRISINDLLAELRQAGIFGLEANGTLSKITYAKFVAFRDRAQNGISQQQDPDAELKSIIASLQADRIPICEHCGISVRRDRLARHVKRAHTKPKADAPPLGKAVLEGLASGVQWKAVSVGRCNSCRKRVAYLDVGAGVLKAFDVDESKKILGTHTCNDVARSESVRTVSGGIIDSNRRRH